MTAGPAAAAQTRRTGKVAGTVDEWINLLNARHKSGLRVVEITTGARLET